MVSEQSPSRAKSSKFTLRQAFFWLAAISVILAAIYNFQEAREARRLRLANARLTQEVEGLKMEAEIKQLENDLKAPTEALVYHALPALELAKIHQQGLKKDHIDHYPQFASVYLNGANDFDLPVKPTEFYCDSSSEHSIENGSYEQFWRNHAPRTCERLTYELTNDKPLGKYLLQNPDVFRRRFRPLLLRLVQGGAFWMRSEACEALIAGGDRTEAVLDSIRGILSEPKQDHIMPGQKVVKQYSSEKRKWIELNERYKLGLPVIDKEPTEPM
jgi:hypothetical protein